MDYSAFLSNEQKENILKQRIAQFAAEAYQHELNKKTSDFLGDTAAVEAADKALEILQAAINTHQTELDSLVTEE